MGLLDLVDEPEVPIGSVSSRMKAKNIELSREWWLHNVAAHNPHLLVWDMDRIKREQIKLYIELLDEAIQDEVGGVKMSDDAIENCKLVREDLIEYL